MKKFIFYLCVVYGVLLCSTTYGEDWSTAVLTNESTDQIEVRVGYDIGETWEAGLLGTWFAERIDGVEWGLGGYLKMSVDPNSSIPVAGWLPPLGDMLSLPESIPAETYLIGKIQVVPYDGGRPDVAAAVGAGASVGPLCLEWVYNLIEEGGTSEPALSSGAQLWFGARLEF